MRGLVFKIALLLGVWYEVAVELGIDSGTALVVTLLLCAAGMMLLRLPGQILALLGPRLILWVGPLAIWAALVWWLLPKLLATYPAVAVAGAACLALAGAAAHYLVTRYPGLYARASRRIGATVTLTGAALLGLAQYLSASLLSVVVLFVIVALPVRLGWRFIGPAAPHRFDAHMGEADDFRRSGFSEDV